MRISVPVDGAIEVIEQTTVSPLLSHMKVKVCYVGQDPNRNGTVITKELATEMGKTLPGAPIVGLFNEQTKDFGGHDKQISVQGGELKIVDITKPYGFVPTNAKVWFQKFSDEGVVHEYLCTECYIWTGAYPESQRIVDQGDNQSMELNKPSIKGFWSNDNNSGNRIFIYTEALVEKLCVLGEAVEPCFEGAQFKSDFSLTQTPEFEEFKTRMFAMIEQLQQSIDKGGSQAMENQNQNPTLEAQQQQEQFAAKSQEEKDKEKDQNPEAGKPEENKEEEDKNKGKKNYNLDEVTEYTDLKKDYEELQTKFNALQAEKTALEGEVATLREFKANTDRKNKQDMIDSFYMLSDEDKKDVVEHIDTYSVDDIEAKLSIICVRNKVSFDLEDNTTGKQEAQQQAPQSLFALKDPDDNVPAWIKAVRETAKN